MKTAFKILGIAAIGIIVYLLFRDPMAVLAGIGSAIGLVIKISKKQSDPTSMKYKGTIVNPTPGVPQSDDGSIESRTKGLNP